MCTCVRERGWMSVSVCGSATKLHQRILRATPAAKPQSQPLFTASAEWRLGRCSWTTSSFLDDFASGTASAHDIAGRSADFSSFPSSRGVNRARLHDVMMMRQPIARCRPISFSFHENDNSLSFAMHNVGSVRPERVFCHSPTFVKRGEISEET